MVLTYHDHDQFHHDEPTQGGYSNTHVLTEDFAIKIPADAPIEKVAPLFCAGITTYSPIMYAGVKRGDQVGVAGLDGPGEIQTFGFFAACTCWLTGLHILPQGS